MAKAKDQDPFARLRTALSERRKERGLKLSDVSAATKVGANKIRQLEEDDTISPRLVHVARLATYYGMSGDEVFALLDLPSGIVPYHSTADGYDTARRA